MLEKFKKLVGVSALAGAAALSQDRGPDTLSMAETKYYEALPGSQVVLDLQKEIPSYRWEEIKKGEGYVGIYCGVYGSDNGAVDSHNPVVEYGRMSTTEIPITLPKPGTEYDGSWGYGYFIICGKEGKFTPHGIVSSEDTVTPEYAKRIVYLVVPDSKKDSKKYFLVK